MTDLGRRRWILLGLLGLIGLGNYGFHRVRPLLSQRSDLLQKSETLKEENTRQAEALVSSEVPDLVPLRKKRKRIEADIEALRKTAVRKTARFAPEAERQGFIVTLSALAEETGLVIESRESWEPEKGAGTPPISPWTLDRILAEPPVDRPLQRWSVRCRYAGLRAFVSGLASLPWQATIVRLRVRHPARSAGAGHSLPLLVDLVIAL